MMCLILKTFLKNVLIFLVLLLFCSPVHADEWDLALKRAKKEDKPVVLYFFTLNCSYCRAMDKEVLAEKDINAILKKSVIYQRIDIEKREELARFYGVRGYPTTAFLEPNGQRIMQIPGYIEKNDFKKLLAFVRGKHYKTMNFKEFLRNQTTRAPLQNRSESLETSRPISQG
jgi:thioredoxin-related protein